MSRARDWSRRREILEALAGELERGGTRVTTARLAAAVGVSEAALYRHFPSKARMFEALIEFAEDSVATLVGRIVAEERDPAVRCGHILLVVLGFAERNPGITRILAGDALAGEDPRLRQRAARFLDRVETQLRQVLREAPGRATGARGDRIEDDAGLLVAAAEGRIARYCRSDFRDPPTRGWEYQWRVLAAALFGSSESA